MSGTAHSGDHVGFNGPVLTRATAVARSSGGNPMSHSTRVDRLRSLGNALVPQIAEWLGRRILEYEGRVN